MIKEPQREIVVLYHRILDVQCLLYILHGDKNIESKVIKLNFQIKHSRSTP